MQWKVRDVAAMVALSGASLMTLASPVSVKMDFALGHVNLRIGETSPGSNDIRADVGAFKGMAGASTGFDTDAFITYCVELTQGFSINTLYAGSYSMVDGASYFGGLNTALAAGPAVALERLVQLFSSLGGAVPPASPDQSAGIQLAVWESLYEGAIYGNVDRDSKTTIDGTFNAIDTKKSAGAIAVANSVLSSAIAYTGPDLYAVQVLTHPTHQDFLVLERRAPPGVNRQSRASTVPEPGTLALVLSALAGIGLAARRRRR